MYFKLTVHTPLQHITKEPLIRANIYWKIVVTEKNETFQCEFIDYNEIGVVLEIRPNFQPLVAALYVQPPS